MKAVRYHSYGDSGVLAHEDAEKPRAAAGQVVLQVAGTSFNFLDIAIRSGFVRELAPIEFPHTPGLDVSGTVAEIGEGVSGWNLGDPAIAVLPPEAPGAAAEYVAAEAASLAPAPRTVPLPDAAALPIAALTAWQSLFEFAKLQAGQRLLINGAGGGVGGHAVRLAKRAEAHVTATAGPRSRDRVEAAGADRIVDYTRTPVQDALAGERFDVVLHLVRNGPEETAALVDLVADGGVLASTTTPGPREPGRGVRVEQVRMRWDAAQLAELAALVDAGELAVEVAERLPLTAIADVHDRAAAGRLLGKTVLTP
ncbi:NADP-dependent oxidoreductase [Glycomyces sp. NRRL B-16210]|uniref:NADP-dependent oxidoreductase n=1 Tax=Glycomyces sp. NRRL B-16210 TaxID=1463821 RepID=UPI0004C23D2C|nr:NADP-dependent oxidoreductase [Glycomyces sp. NRRL B-16210]